MFRWTSIVAITRRSPNGISTTGNIEYKGGSIMNIFDSRINFSDSLFFKMHTYTSGHKVAIYNITSYSGLNQAIGYAKFINADSAIYYRGECKLHSTMQPCIHRNMTSQRARNHAKDRINKMVNRALNDYSFSKYVKLEKTNRNSKYVIESVLQHYGVATRCIDVVDNHWAALWFGLNNCITKKILNSYCQYQKRSVRILDILAKDFNDEMCYQYLILLAANYVPRDASGVSIGNDTITIDLRSAVPSMFLRPHAQHGWIIRKNVHGPNCNYDLSENVVAILRIRIDLAEEWLGNGQLLSMNNMFPSPAIDQGYDVLLSRPDLFSDGINTITKYVY